MIFAVNCTRSVMVDKNNNTQKHSNRLTGGLVVASSNLVAPTNKNRDLAIAVESLFLFWVTHG